MLSGTDSPTAREHAQGDPAHDLLVVEDVLLLPFGEVIELVAIEALDALGELRRAFEGFFANRGVGFGEDVV